MIKKDQKGTTIIELLVVIAAGTLLMGVVFNFFWEYWKYAERAQSDSDAFVSRLDVGDYIRETVGTSSGLITQNSIADSNASPNDVTAGANYWQSIHPIPGTVTKSTSNQPLLYFKRYSQNSSKAFIMNGSNPYEDEYVMYLNSSGEIRIRTLANSSATGNVLKTSCPPASATSTCPADKLIINNITSVAVRYFSRSGGLIDYTPYYDATLGQNVNGPDFPFVEVIEYTINLARSPLTQTSNTTRSSTVIRIALRNT